MDNSKQFFIEYVCYECGHTWYEVYDCACDSECPSCDAKDVTPTSYEQMQ